MDYGHHDAIHFHRVYSLQAVDRCLNHHGTMMGNQVMMMVIHTLRLTQDDTAGGRISSFHPVSSANHLCISSFASSLTPPVGVRLSVRRS